MTEKEKAAKGYLYDANYDKELLSEIDKCSDLYYEFNRIKPSDRVSQEKLLRKIFGRTGKNPIVNAPFYCGYGYNTSVGDCFFANYNCQILDGGKVTFGDHVFIAPNCCFTTAEHAIDAEQRNQGLEVALPIVVGNNVWIGAGSVVTKDIPANVIAVGVPCRVLREITEKDKEKYPRYKD